MAEERDLRREFKRESTLLLLDVMDADNPNKYGRACVLDISLGGVAFESNLSFKRDEDVVLRFTYDSSKVYVIKGAIKRVSHGTGTFIYGVKFRKLNIFEKSKLKKMISRIKGKQE